MSRFLAAAAVIGLLFATPAMAQVADTVPFVEACTAVGPEAFGLADAAQSAAFCGCLGTELSSRPQADVDVLLADLKGTSTEASHAAHGNYEAVEEAARDSVNKCITDVVGEPTTGMVEVPDPNRVAPDMAGFDANCRASTRLKAYLASAAGGADAALDKACGCVSASLAGQFSQSIVDFLGEQLAAADPSALASTATEEQDAAGTAAEQIMGQCLASASAS